jgi:hypothetical protein
MSQWQLDQLSNLSHLFSAATNVIVADFVEIALFIFTLYWLALAVNDCVLCNDAVLGGINFDNFEFDLSHGSSNCEEIALSDRSVRFAEVWGEEDIEERAGETFNGIGDGENSNSLGLGGALVKVE